MQPNMPPLRHNLATLGLLVALAIWAWIDVASAKDDGRQEPNPKVLIEELASPEFETRRLAQEQLQAMGLGAFDVLLDAQFHPDVEVAHRARFILRSMSIEWVKESDPKDVKQILRNYGKSDPIDRRPQIEAVAQLEDQRGVAALCRLSNFEFDPILSKYAALQIMQMDLTDSPGARDQITRAIEIHARPSQRPASKWLKEYARFLAAPTESLPEWKRIIDDERKQVQEDSPNTSREMAGLLCVWYADALRSQSKKEESLTALRQSLEYVEPNEMQIRDAVVGLITREGHVVVDELATHFKEIFSKDPYLCYLHAEALKSRTRPAGEAVPQEQIDRLVARAKELVGENYPDHRLLALFLLQRGQFDWFEQESQLVLKATDVLDEDSIRVRNDLVQLLDELQRFDDAVEVLKPLVDEVAKTSVGDSGPLGARLHHLQARSAAQKRQFSLQKTHLKAAIEADLENSDIIIDMYRAEEADAQWKELTQSCINTAVKMSEENLRRIEADAGNGQAIDVFEFRHNTRIAIEYNQYAWLVANTNGDLDKAISRSRQSLELYHRRNHSTFQDTLARCYFAKGDLENAVKFQRKAVKQEPFDPAMLRQLALFENALKNAATTAKEKK